MIPITYTTKVKVTITDLEVTFLFQSVTYDNAQQTLEAFTKARRLTVPILSDTDVEVDRVVFALTCLEKSYVTQSY